MHAGKNDLAGPRVYHVVVYQHAVGSHRAGWFELGSQVKIDTFLVAMSIGDLRKALPITFLCVKAVVDKRCQSKINLHRDMTTATVALLFRRRQREAPFLECSDQWPKFAGRHLKNKIP